MECLSEATTTQLTLGLDRDSGIVTHIANENDESVRALMSDYP